MDQLSKANLARFDTSEKEINNNLDYLENRAFTAEQLKRMNKARRLFYAENKLNKQSEVVLSGNVNYA